MGGQGSAPCWEVYIDQGPYGHSGYHHCLQWSIFSRRAWRNGRLISGEKTHKDFQVSNGLACKRQIWKNFCFIFLSSRSASEFWGGVPLPRYEICRGGQEIQEQPKYAPVEPPPRWRNGTLAARKTLSDRFLFVGATEIFLTAQSFSGLVEGNESLHCRCPNWSVEKKRFGSVFNRTEAWSLGEDACGGGSYCKDINESQQDGSWLPSVCLFSFHLCFNPFLLPNF